MEEQQPEQSTTETILEKLDLIQAVVDTANCVVDDEEIFINKKALLKLWRTTFLEFPSVFNILRTQDEYEEPNE